LDRSKRDKEYNKGKGAIKKKIRIYENDIIRAACG
jgi:hypothetical protein